MADAVVEVRKPGPGDALENLAQKVDGIFHPISKNLTLLAMFLVAVMIFSVTLDVCLKLANISFPWISEAVTYMMGILTFVSLSYVGSIKGHIKIDLFTDKMPETIRSGLLTAHHILELILVLFLAWRIFVYAGSVRTLTGAVLTKLPVSVIIYIMFVGICFYIPITLGEMLHTLGSFLNHFSIPGLLIMLGLPALVWTVPFWFGAFGFNATMAGVIGILLMIFLILSGLSLAFALGSAGAVMFAYLTNFSALMGFTGRALYTSVGDYYLAVIPFFVVMGTLVADSGLGADLFKAMKAWAGKLPGSLAIATVFTGAAFGAVCGDSFATAATIGKVSLPEMKKAGYPLSMASGAVAAGGTLGIMIPPSNVFIIYAILTETSIAELFIAGVIPGIMLAVLISGTLYIQAIRDPRVKGIEVETLSLKEKIVATKGVLPILLLFLLCIGGIYLGWFTPVEGGAVGAAGSFLFILFKDRKNFKLSMVKTALLEGAQISGMILFLMAGIEFINSSLALSKIPMDLSTALFNSGLSDWMIFWIFILLFLAAGFILNIIVVLMLIVPILLPSLIAMGLNLTWFGVIFTLVTMIGQLTPPIGVVCFVVKTLDKDLKLEDVFKGVTALWMAMIVGLVLLILIPDIALYLVKLMG